MKQWVWMYSESEICVWECSKSETVSMSVLKVKQWVWMYSESKTVGILRKKVKQQIWVC